MEVFMKRLNWIDILIIVVLVGALAFVGFKALGGNEAVEEVDETALSAPTLEYIVEITDITRELAENAMASLDDEPRDLDGVLVPMDRIYNSNKLADAEITAWEILDGEEEGMATLRVTIAANPSIYRCNYLVGNQELRLGKDNYIVKTMSVELTGTIVSITELGNE